MTETPAPFFSDTDPPEIVETAWGAKLRQLADEVDAQIAYMGDGVILVSLARTRGGEIVAAVVTDDDWDGDE